VSDGSIHLTAAQVAALVTVTAGDQTVAVRQLGGANGRPGDIYVTAVGASTGVRIAPDGATQPIDETLPA
jgi:hypothetical protein